MSANISSLEDAASAFYRGRANYSALADTIGMENTSWRGRLAEAIAASGMSKRAVSLAANAGAGYVHSILSEGKDPTIEKLMAVCEVVHASPTFILYGVDVRPEDAELLSAMREDPGTRDAGLQLLRHRKVP